MKLSQITFADSDGFIKRECPNCFFTYKISASDWESKVFEYEVFCPKCRQSSSSDCWWTEDNFGTNAQLSPNAWVMLLPISVDKYNKEALEKIGYKTPCDVETLKKRPIWAQKHNGPATSVDSNITWK